MSRSLSIRKEKDVISYPKIDRHLVMSKIVQNILCKKNIFLSENTFPACIKGYV